MKPSMPVAIVLMMIPQVATTLFIWGQNNQHKEVARPVNGNNNPLCMLHLFGNVARGVKAGQYGLGEEASGEHCQVMDVIYSLCQLVSTFSWPNREKLWTYKWKEDKLCQAESIGVVNGDWEPDEADKKVKHQDEECEAEHGLVPPWGDMIDCN